MKFTALPVKIGDAFLLEDKNFKVLVDGGKDPLHIIQLLDNHKIKNKHIDILICTHYDSDHINGILGILESSAYHFKEIWLPKLFGDIGYSISKRTFSYLEYFDELAKRDSKDETKGSFDTEDIDVEVLSFFVSKKDWLFHLNLYFEELNYEKTKILLYLFDIGNFVSKCISTGANIRWLEYKNNETNKKYNPYIPFFGKNSIQSKLTSYKTIKDLYKEIFLTPINKKSLVFLYNDEENPNILFSSDSSFDFITSNILLKDGSLVTAPHHGAKENAVVYSKISGNDLVYVRSDKFNTYRPCDEYKSLSNKFCTRCNSFVEQKVIFELKNGKFNTKANKCSCT